MDNQFDHSPNQQQGGFVLYAAITIVMVLLATGIAFMRWSVDESLQTEETIAAMQAYYLGQMGIVEKGFSWLQSLPANDLPVGETILEGERVAGYGKYENVNIYAINQAGGDFWTQERQFRISAVGVVRVPMYQNGRSTYKDVRRKAVLYVEVRNFSDYMYLSDEERTRFGDWIKFWGGDTLDGRVHSNSMIAVMQNPVFYEQVTSTAADFWHGIPYNPVFRGPLPVFRAPPVVIPQVAENLRIGASAQSHFFTDAGGQFTYYARFMGGSVKMWRWETGTEIDSTDNWTITLSSQTCIFVDAPLWMHGIVTGTVTIGSGHLVRLMDNITVTEHDAQGRVPLSNRYVIGIVSEGDVKIANTPANGRENSRWGQDIIITAAIVALGESFTFENQNDPDSGYVSPTIPDNRGTIYLYGSVTQMRRGYVHRSTNSSTGYLKQYRYDKRLLRQRPPCFFDAQDDEGHALFNIVQWGQGKTNPSENNLGNYVRFN